MIPQSTNLELGSVATPLRSLTDCHPKLFWPPHFRSPITSTVTSGGHGKRLTTGYTPICTHNRCDGRGPHPTRVGNGTSRHALQTDSRVPLSPPKGDPAAPLQVPQLKVWRPWGASDRLHREQDPYRNTARPQWNKRCWDYC